MSSDAQDEKEIAFYQKTIAKWVPSSDCSILVLGAGRIDCEVFSSLGFRNVTMSNLYSAPEECNMFDYKWLIQDLEKIEAADNTYDYTVSHRTLHHCRKPHDALCEMYRVASKAALVFEPHDCFAVRCMQRLGLAQTYEVGSHIQNARAQGLVESHDLPNFVYRLSKREAEKALAARDVRTRPHMDCRLYSGLPLAIQRMKRLSFRALVAKTAFLAYRTMCTILPSQNNKIALRIYKMSTSEDMHPWLKNDDKGRAVLVCDSDIGSEKT